MPASKDDWLSIGQIADRTGLAISAVRYYETQGLVSPDRNNGGQRRFRRTDIRRLSFVMIAQQLGLSISDIRSQLNKLPSARTPTQKDWRVMSGEFRRHIEERIAALELMRDRLDGCIGCGCLSLRNCALYNPSDRVSAKGSGPRYLLGDEPPSG